MSEIRKRFDSMSDTQLEQLVHFAENAKAEVAALRGKDNKEMIKLFIEEKAKMHPFFEENYLHNPMGKTINDCYDYIVSQMKKTIENHPKTGCVGVCESSMIIFDLTEQYFLDETIAKYVAPKTQNIPKKTDAKKDDDKKETADSKSKKTDPNNNKKKFQELSLFDMEDINADENDNENDI